MRKKRLVRVGLLIALALVLIGVVVYVWSLRGSKPNVTLTINYPQKEYKLGDEITITLIITNKGDSVFPDDGLWLERIPYIGYWFARKRKMPSHMFDLEVRYEDGRVCADPRVISHSTGGSILQGFEVKPGESRRRNETVNEYALIGEAGNYLVVGRLLTQGPAGGKLKTLFQSPPLVIVIQDRTYEEMGRYIERLIEELKNAKYRSKRWDVLSKLMYTRDSRIVPALLESAYEDKGETWTYYDALTCYLPLDEGIRDTILEVARKRGLISPMIRALERYGCTDKQFRELIAISLASDNPRCVEAGAFATLRHPDDSHMARLIEIASGRDDLTRLAIALAIASNRTGAGVGVLKDMLTDSDEVNRMVAKDAIRIAYRRAQAYHNLRKTEITIELVDKARDPNKPERWDAVRELVEGLSDEDFASVKALVDEPSRDIEIDGTNEAVNTIVEMLKDSDRDVRDLMTTLIRTNRRGHYGRPLNPEDFPEIYAECKKEREAQKKD